MSIEIFKENAGMSERYVFQPMKKGLLATSWMRRHNCDSMDKRRRKS